MTKLTLHADRLFPADKTTRDIARALYANVKNLPIISPHGHTDPSWFADNAHFPNPSELLITPDHYVFRMLYSQGIPLEKLGMAPISGNPVCPVETDPREAWRHLANNYHLFAGTPSRMWLDWVFAEVFGLEEQLCADTSDTYFDTMDKKLKSEAFRPRALFNQFNIEIIATTEDPLDPLIHHQKLQANGWGKKVVTTFRPDNVLDPEFEGFTDHLNELGEITDCDTGSYQGYLEALRKRRDFFKSMGATATDHGHVSAFTVSLNEQEAEVLYQRVSSGPSSAKDAELFRGHMLMEMAKMSIEDGLVMQIHPGVHRSHNADVLARFGKDKGADIPIQSDYVNNLLPLLNTYGNHPDFTVIVFTLDETSYSRELAPLAGHYPAMKLGPPWWFNDSPEGMRRFREQTTETAGFYNTVGFNDDTRAFLSIPARHDVARRMDCGFLAKLVAEHRMGDDEAHQVAHDLSYALAKKAYKF